MKLLLAIRDLNIGGAQRQFIELIKNIDKEKFDILVVSMYGGVREDELNVKHINLKKKGRFDIASYFKYKKIVDEFKPRVIYSFLGEMNLFSYWAGYKKSKLIWSIRSAETDLKKYGKFSAFLFDLQKRYSPKIDMFISNSQSALKAYENYGFKIKNSSVIYNGIDTLKFRKFKMKNNKKPVIGMAARFTKVKGFDIFAQALNKLFTHYDVEVRIAGDGDNEIKKEFLKNTHGRVKLLGNIKDMENFYNDIDILVSSSYVESFSNSIAEAMACEVPCVVTDVGDSKVIVGDTGIVVKPTYESLYEGIEKMLSLDYGKLGEKARRRIVDNFSINRMVENTQEEILKCAES